MASGNKKIFLWNLNNRTIKNSNVMEALYKSLGVSSDGTDKGTSITEASGSFDFNNKVLGNIANGTAAGQALSYSQRGAAAGVASLDHTGKVPASQLPYEVMSYKGNWDALTNTPTLSDVPTKASAVIQDVKFVSKVAGPDGNSITVEYTAGGVATSEVVTQVGNTLSVKIQSGVSTAQNIVDAVNVSVANTLVDAEVSGFAENLQIAPVVATILAGGSVNADVGDFYRVSVGNTIDLGSGPQIFAVGDMIIYGTVWDKSPATDSVTSVNGFTAAVSLGTNEIPEGTNLYYTQERIDAAVAAKTTSDLAEGTNLYYTQDRVDAAVASKTTDDLAEGSINLYLSGKTTDALPEGTNLYYTQNRFDTALQGKSTDDLTEGTVNKYFSGKNTDLLTEGTVNTYFSGKTTSQLSEGTNLYYTQNRFDTALQGKSTDNLAEGAVNKYFSGKNTDLLTEGTVNTYFSGKNTDLLTEGTVNKYFSGKTTDGLPQGSVNKYATAYPGFTDYVESVSGSPKTTFILPAIALEADHKVDVGIDGRDQPLEGTHWSRVVGNPGQIVMTGPVNVGSYFKARVYTKYT